MPNPENDAADIDALRRLGFGLATRFDAARVELTDALRAFARPNARADVSSVFYAGHGIEMDRANHVVPVETRLRTGNVDVRFETVSLDDLPVSTAGASLRRVIPDACRNNPLARSMQRTAASRSVSGGSFGNLNENVLGDETLVAYAAPGTRALATGTSVSVSTAAPVDPAAAGAPCPDPPETDVTELHIVALGELAADTQHELAERYANGRDPKACIACTEGSVVDLYPAALGDHTNSPCSNSARPRRDQLPLRTRSPSSHHRNRIQHTQEVETCSYALERLDVHPRH